MKNNNENKQLCKTCIYHSGYEHQDLVCCYILRTGHRRPCDHRNCTVYKKGESIGKKFWNKIKVSENGTIFKEE